MSRIAIPLAVVLFASTLVVAVAPGASAHHCNGVPCETTPKEAILHLQWELECTIDETLAGDGCDTGGPGPGP